MREPAAIEPIDSTLASAAGGGADWAEAEWTRLDAAARAEALAAATTAEALLVLGRHARRVIRAFSSSFFVVTRFLPAAKRTRVELVYAAVRYPDEIVDTFPLDAGGRRERLAAWGAGYEQALAAGGLRRALADGLPAFACGMAAVVREARIPPEHYRSFLLAMRRDIEPRPFADLDELVERYVYGSAVVVGFFLAHVYGASGPDRLRHALATARHLAIALQLTNFLRDVAEDHDRGRLYLPLDILGVHGIRRLDPHDPSQREPLAAAVRELAARAEEGYRRAEAGLDDFAADCRPAIAACIEVYRELNRRVGRAPDEVLERQSVPLYAKLRVLPPSKYWRLPLAFLGLQERLESYGR